MHCYNISPPPALQQLINGIWVVEVGDAIPQPERMIPFGCMDLVFYRNGQAKKIHMDGTQQKLSAAMIFGQTITPYWLQLSPGMTVLGVGFLPHTAHLLTKSSSKAFTDQSIGLSDVLGEKMAQWSRDITAASTTEEAIMLLQRALISAISSSFPHRNQAYLNHLLRSIILQKGNIDLTLLARYAGVSLRYVEKLFQEFVGLRPGQFCRVQRFLHATQTVDQYPSLTELALACGYFDQSHFIREVRRFTHLSPKQYFAEQKQM
ncbi:MAG: helix-turn-helix domain-containing protein, partial [Bacteroidota bacterium]